MLSKSELLLVQINKKLDRLIDLAESKSMPGVIDPDDRILQMLNNGRLTINQAREIVGLPRSGYPEADMFMKSRSGNE